MAPTEAIPTSQQSGALQRNRTGLNNILAKPTIGTLEQTERERLLALMDVLYRTNDKLQQGDTSTSHAPPLGVAPSTPQPRSPQTTVTPTGQESFSGTAINTDTGKPAEYKELSQSSDGPQWEIAINMEMGRQFHAYQCPQQTHDTKETDPCSFIHKHDLLPDTKPTYVRIVAD
jgi:hypothetical protein